MNVPTLWMVFVINFLAVALIWAYVAYTYPKLEAARLWAASSFVAALGGFLAMLIVFEDGSLVPLWAGGTVMVFAACLAAMGIERFYEQPVSWRSSILITGATCAGLVVFMTGYDSAAMRVLIYS